MYDVKPLSEYKERNCNMEVIKIRRSDGVPVLIYESAKYASRAEGNSETYIAKVIKGKAKGIEGYDFCYINEFKGSLKGVPYYGYENKTYDQDPLEDEGWAIHQVRKNGNTVLSPEVIEQCGGVDNVIEIFRRKGLDVKIRITIDGHPIVERIDNVKRSKTE